MDRGNTFSLTIMVIVMALLAVFVGYLLGNWLIQLVTGDVSYQQAYDKQIEKEETVEDESSSTLPSTSENLDNQSRNQNSNIQKDKNKTNNNSTNSQRQFSGDVYVIQIGAFSKINNARELKQKLADKGFQVVINSEGSLHKVQMAVNGEEEAEQKKTTLNNLGYNVFVTH